MRVIIENHPIICHYLDQTVGCVQIWWQICIFSAQCLALPRRNTLQMRRHPQTSMHDNRKPHDNEGGGGLGQTSEEAVEEFLRGHPLSLPPSFPPPCCPCAHPCTCARSIPNETHAHKGATHAPFVINVHLGQPEAPGHMGYIMLSEVSGEARHTFCLEKRGLTVAWIRHQGKRSDLFLGRVRNPV